MSDTSDPLPSPGWPTAPPGAPIPNVGFPEVPRPTEPGHGIGHLRVIVSLVIGLGVLALILILAAVLNEPVPPPHCAPLKCQGPPLGTPFNEETSSPVLNGTLYHNSQGFSLRYYPRTTPLSGVTSATDGSATGIELTYSFPSSDGGSGQLIVLGAPADNTTPQAMISAMINSIAPGAQPVYQLPGALIGYQLGVGEAFNYQPVSSNGSASTDRVIVMAGINNGFGIWVVAAGALLPNVTPSGSLWNGHPSPANVNVAYIADETVNSITFPRELPVALAPGRSRTG